MINVFKKIILSMLLILVNKLKNDYSTKNVKNEYKIPNHDTFNTTLVLNKFFGFMAEANKATKSDTVFKNRNERKQNKIRLKRKV